MSNRKASLSYLFIYSFTVGFYLIIRLPSKPFQNCFSGSFSTDGYSISLIFDQTIPRAVWTVQPAPQDVYDILGDQPTVYEEDCQDQDFQDQDSQIEIVAIDPGKQDLLFCLSEVRNRRRFRLTQDKRRRQLRTKKWRGVWKREMHQYFVSTDGQDQYSVKEALDQIPRFGKSVKVAEFKTFLKFKNKEMQLKLSKMLQRNY